jgi:hypothetical protein
MSKDGYIARFVLGQTELASVSVVPITQDPEGHPVIARGEVFDRIAERLESLCRPLGSSVEVSGDGLRILPTQSTAR